MKESSAKGMKNKIKIFIKNSTYVSCNPRNVNHTFFNTAYLVSKLRIPAPAKAIFTS